MDQPISSSLKGQLLIAMPSLTDPNFDHAVVCISEHTSEGAVGIVINQVYEGLNGQTIFQELAIPCDTNTASIPIHIGGPVHRNELFILHSKPLDWDDSLIINSNLALSNSRSVLEAIGVGHGPDTFIISLGCSGWGPEQLEWELKQNAWLTSDYHHELLFTIPVAERWEMALKHLGVDPHLLSNIAGNA